MHAFLALAVLLLVRPMLFLRRSAGVLARPSWQRWRSATTAGATNEPNPTSRVSIERIPTSYTDLLRELYQINMYHPVKLGLQNMERLYDLLERPLDDIPIVHITGTNGKGSVALKVARCLSAKGLRTGLFVSPHIASFRERIQVDASLVSEEEVEAFLPRVMRLCVEHDIPATFFEVTTALAFLCYRHRRCEALVLEVGLGGRLDATNVIPAPVLAIMTSVQLDHQKILGATRELIAREKAGIFKRGSAVLLGPETPQAVVVPQARAAGASPIVSLTDMACVLGERTGAALFDASRAAQPPTFGYADTDHLNSDLARAALHLLQHPTLADDAALRAKQELLARRLAHSAVSSVALVRDEPLRLALRARPPCRFEQFALVSLGVPDRGAPQGLRAVPCRDVRVVLDIAHNIEAMGALVRRLRVFFPHSPLRYVPRAAPPPPPIVSNPQRVCRAAWSWACRPTRTSTSASRSCGSWRRPPASTARRRSTRARCRARRCGGCSTLAAPPMAAATTAPCARRWRARCSTPPRRATRRRRTPPTRWPPFGRSTPPPTLGRQRRPPRPRWWSCAARRSSWPRRAPRWGCASRATRCTSTRRTRSRRPAAVRPRGATCRSTSLARAARAAAMHLHRVLRGERRCAASGDGSVTRRPAALISTAASPSPHAAN